MKKKYTFFLLILLITSITASEDPDDKINTKTPHDASKIAPEPQEAEKHLQNESPVNSRIGRKRRRQSIASERKQMAGRQSNSKAEVI